MTAVAPTLTYPVQTGARTQQDGPAASMTKLSTNDAALLQYIQNVQADIAALAAKAYVTPPGAYVPPAAGGAQVYGVNATSWRNCLSAGRTMLYLGTANAVVGDLWDAASMTDFAITSSASGSTLYRITRTSAGAATVAASISLSTANVIVMSWVAISPSVLRLLISISTSFLECLVTWSGSALSLSTVVANIYPYSAIQINSNYRRGLLVGASSWATFHSQNTGYAGPNLSILRSRALSSVSQIAISGFSWQNQMATSQDYLGSGLVVTGSSSLSPADGTVRPALTLDQYGDYGTTRLGTLRIGTTFTGWTSIVALSSTLVLAQYKDGSNNLQVIAVSVNTANVANPMGLYGPFNAGNLGTQPFTYPFLYSALNAFALRQNAATTATLMSAIFNAANAGTELTSVSGNDIAVPLGAANSTQGQAAIAGLTAAALGAAWQTNTPNLDQFATVYGATATANAVWYEAFSLS